MEGAEDQMSGLGSPNGDLDGLPVAHFADHHDIGIATQDATEGIGKGEVDLRLHGDLDDPVDLVLHRDPRSSRCVAQ